MSTRKKLSSNAFYLFLDKIWFILTSFFFWLILGKVLSPNEYGIVATSLQIALFSSLISTTGLMLSLRKLIPEYLSNKNMYKINTLTKFSTKFTFFVALVTMIFLSFLYLLNFLGLGREVFIVTLAIFIFYTSSTFLSNFLYGYQNMKRIFVADLISWSVKLFSLITSLYYFSLGYLGALISFAIGSFLRAVLQLNKEILKVLFIKESNARKIIEQVKRDLMKYMTHGYAIGIMSNIYRNSHFIILSFLTGPYITGIFAVAFRLSYFIGLIPSILNMSAFPIISQLSAGNERYKQQKLLAFVLRILFVVTVPLIAFIGVFSREIVLLFSKPEYLEASIYLPLLSIIFVVLSFSSLFLSTLYAIKKPSEYTKVYFVSISIYLPLSYFLVKYFSALGLILSFGVSAILLLITSFVKIKRYLHVDFRMLDMKKVILSTILSLFVLLTLKSVVSSKYLPLYSLPLFLGLYVFGLCRIRYCKSFEMEVLSYAGHRFKHKIIKRLIEMIKDKCCS